MTDNEIIKALECCSCMDSCSVCPGEKVDCEIEGYAISLINRQKAEIEALIAGQETLQKYIAKCRAEAVKEFAERFEKEFVCAGGMYRVHPVLFDNLVKEMVGEEDG